MKTISFWGWVLGILCSVSGNMVMTQSPHYRQHSERTLESAQSEGDYDAAYTFSRQKPTVISEGYTLRRNTYGFHPGWQGTTYEYYDFGVLTDIGYYGYLIDPETGRSSSNYFWESTPLIDLAHAQGTRVELVVATGNANQTRTLLQNPKAMQTLRDSVMALVTARKGDGICLELPELAPTESSAFASLVETLADTLSGYLRRASLTIVLPPDDPNKAYPIGKVRPFTSRFIIRTYATRDIDQNSLPAIDQAVTFWLQRGVARESMLLGLPLYSNLPDDNSGKAIPYSVLREKHSQNVRWDSAYASHRSNGNAADMIVPDSRSLGVRFDRVFERNLAGVALWALSYDHGFPEVQRLLREKFARGTGYKQQLTENDSIPPGWITEDGGQTRLRNEYNWVWMMVGCVFLVILLLIMKRYF